MAAYKGIKITTIVTASGISRSITIHSVNRYDSTLLPECLQNYIINWDSLKRKNTNLWKQYFLADKGYDPKNNIKLLESKGYTAIIP